jgi:hypothetical protein
LRKQLLRLVLALLVVGVCAGARCHRSPSRPPPAAAHPSKVDYFKQSQAATMTPHGAIDMTSVTETPDGVEYRTSDGSTWRVVMEPTANGYRFRGDPEPVK